jgi:hypothetical protein
MPSLLKATLSDTTILLVNRNIKLNLNYLNIISTEYAIISKV